MVVQTSSAMGPTLGNIKSIRDLEGLREATAQVFQEAQLSLSGHKKLIIILKNIHLRSVQLNYEEGFGLKFIKLLNKILPLKKGEESGDRIAKFISAFIRDSYKDANNEGEVEIIDKFVDNMLQHLLRGIQAKDRNVRYRVVQLLSYLLNYINGSVDIGVLKILVWSLDKRLYDKESNVRIQSVIAIARFQYLDLRWEDEESNMDLEEVNAVESLIQVLRNDESAEVRRAALLNLVKNDYTMPFIIERARDNNAINRRLVYSRVLKEFGDFRFLETDARLKLIHWGLTDRDESVKTAAMKTFNNSWFETVHKNIFEFLEYLDLSENNEFNDLFIRKIFELNFDMVKGFKFDERYWKELTSDKAYLLRNLYEFLNMNNYHTLIDEKFLDSIELSDFLYKYLKLRKTRYDENRELIDQYLEVELLMKQCRTMGKNLDYDVQEVKDQAAEVAAQEESNNSNDKDLKEIMEKVELKLRSLEKDKAYIRQRKEEILTRNAPLLERYDSFKSEMNDLELLIEHLLRICEMYDFSDEIGRRSMLQIIRTSLTNDSLTDKLAEVALKVLKRLSINERDFTSMCIEIITDIRDSDLDENDETFHSAVSGFHGDDDEDDESGADSEDDDDEGDDDDGDEQPDDEEYTNNLNRIQNVFDNENFNNSYSKTGKKRRKLEPKHPPKKIMVPCLYILQHLLELINEPLEHNYSFYSLYNSMVLPAFNMDDDDIFTLGLKCLGLFSLLDKELAIEKFHVAYRLILRGGEQENLMICIKWIIDVLSTYGISILLNPETQKNIPVEHLITSSQLGELFSELLNNQFGEELQSLTAEGLSKLFLADILEDFGKKDGNTSTNAEEREFTESKILQDLIAAYFHPSNGHNNSLKQTLSFCLPVYAFSHNNHQSKLAQVTGSCIFKLLTDKYSMDPDYFRELNLTLIVQQFIHWCDPVNLVNKSDMKYEAPLLQVGNFLQLIEQVPQKPAKKIVINNLNKVGLHENLGSNTLRVLLGSIEETKKIIEEKKETDGNYSFDSLTMKNFDKFYQHVQRLCQQAQEMEEQDSHLILNISERTGHASEDNIQDPDQVAEEKKDVASQMEVEEDMEEQEMEEDKMEGQQMEQDNKEPNTATNEQELNDIDEFLDAEDKVDYEI